MGDMEDEVRPLNPDKAVEEAPEQNENQPIANEEAEQAPLQKAGWLTWELKKITIIIIMIPTVTCLALKLQTITDKGPRYVPHFLSLQKVSKNILFGLSIFYTYLIFFNFVFKSIIWELSPRLQQFRWLRWLCSNENERPTANQPPLGSFTLRLITLPICLFGYIIWCVCTCKWEWGWKNQMPCAAGSNVDKIIDAGFILGVAIFVFNNHLYESKNMRMLTALFVLLSATLYKYLSTIILEGIYIYEEVYHKYGNGTHNEELSEPEFTLYPAHTDGPYFLPFHSDEPGIDCKDGTMDCLMKEYVEMFYVAVSELLVTALCIIWGRIYQTEEPEPRIQRNLSLRRIVVWAGITVVFVGLQVFLIWLYGAKIVEEETSAKVGAIKFLDRNSLFNVGMIGIGAYTIMGAVHSCNLITGDYNTFHGWMSFWVNILSLTQTLFQTWIMMEYKMTGYMLNFSLAIVNYFLFSLDLFDAVTLGIYSNPIFGDTNLKFLLIVRLLEPFNVFYRFHSFSVLTENVEHRLALHDPQPNMINNVDGVENEGFDATRRNSANANAAENKD